MKKKEKSLSIFLLLAALLDYTRLFCECQSNQKNLIFTFN